MKTNKSKMRILPILMALVLMLVSMPTTAFAAAKSFSAIVKSGGMKVYRDVSMKRYWGSVPANAVVYVRNYAGNVARITYGGRTGYAEVDDMNAVQSVAKKAVTARNTYVFKTASSRSARAAVRKGTAVYLLAANGNLAKVERNGVVGYTRLDHLIVEGQSSGSVNNSMSTQDRFEQAFKEQQEALKQQEEAKQEAAKQEEANKNQAASKPSAEPVTELEKVFASGKYTNEQLCYLFLTKVAGYNSAAACGIVANIKYESGFKPGSIGDGGQSLGICQWYASRKNLLISWCESKNLDPESLLGQLYFLQYELEVRYPNAHKYLKAVENSAEGAYDAAYYFCYNYERPANKGSKSVTRGNYAKSTTWPRFANV